MQHEIPHLAALHWRKQSEWGKFREETEESSLRNSQYLLGIIILRATSNTCKRSRIWSPNVILQVKGNFIARKLANPPFLSKFKATEGASVEKLTKQRSIEKTSEFVFPMNSSCHFKHL
jgi:hypothetical protein